MKILSALTLLIVLATPALARTLDDMRASGVLACGVVLERPGFSARDKNYQWSGFDVDICRAIAAAVVGDPLKVNFVALADDELVVALQSGEVDVLPRGPQLSHSIDTSNGLIFVTPTFFEDASDGRVEVFGPFIRQGDTNWQQVVRWTIWSLIEAERLGIQSVGAASGLENFLAVTKADSALSLGLDAKWTAITIGAVGNYGEIFERHFGATAATPKPRGPNKLWRDGGLFFAPSFN